jgi:Immunity protein 35
MLNETEAVEVAERYIAEVNTDHGKSYALMHDKTVCREFGWLFVYNTREYIETGSFLKAALGNTPLIVDRTTGDLAVCPAGLSVPECITWFENRV